MSERFSTKEGMYEKGILAGENRYGDGMFPGVGSLTMDQALAWEPARTRLNSSSAGAGQAMMTAASPLFVGSARVSPTPFIVVNETRQSRAEKILLLFKGKARGPAHDHHSPGQFLAAPL